MTLTPAQRTPTGLPRTADRIPTGDGPLTALATAGGPDATVAAVLLNFLPSRRVAVLDAADHLMTRREVDYRPGQGGVRLYRQGDLTSVVTGILQAECVHSTWEATGVVDAWSPADPSPAARKYGKLGDVEQRCAGCGDIRTVDPTTGETISGSVTAAVTR